MVTQNRYFSFKPTSILNMNHFIPLHNFSANNPIPYPTKKLTIKMVITVGKINIKNNPLIAEDAIKAFPTENNPKMKTANE